MIRPSAVPARAWTLALILGLVGDPGAASIRAGEPSGDPSLDVRAATRAIDAVRHALPEGWERGDVRWKTVPQGWQGPPECVLIEVHDQTLSFNHDESGFRYHPFYKIWLLPPGWEGRMEVAAMKPSAPHAMYLGESDSFRVLIRTLGRNTWPEGPEVLGRTLDLETYPLSHRPEHTLDVMAMQRLFQRLDASTSGKLDRWRSQIYGIEELNDLLYLELLTWEDRAGKEREEDPTFLGDLAERETRFLSREALAAFPTKRGLYLRRVTRESFSDVIVVNPAHFEL